MKKYPLLIDPPLTYRIWGGDKLNALFESGQNIAEAYILSIVDGYESVVANGSLTGKKLSAVFEDYPDWVGLSRQNRFPICIKLFNTSDYTSVQVHPSDAYAISRLHSFGKGEIWYIIDADENSGVYVGLKEDTAKDEIKQAVEDKTILDKLNYRCVKAGDIVEIKAGTIHTLTKGILALAIQENSKISYRLYDFDRPSDTDRPLNLDTALEVTDTAESKDFLLKLPYRLEKDRFVIKQDFSPYFIFSEYEINNEKLINHNSLTWLMPLEDKLVLEYLRNDKLRQVELNKLNGVIIPKDLECRVMGKSKIIKIEL